jgi:hypothetical protein
LLKNTMRVGARDPGLNGDIGCPHGTITGEDLENAVTKLQRSGG